MRTRDEASRRVDRKMLMFAKSQASLIPLKIGPPMTSSQLLSLSVSCMRKGALSYLHDVVPAGFISF